jgi:hypothetical protein
MSISKVNSQHFTELIGIFVHAVWKRTSLFCTCFYHRFFWGHALELPAGSENAQNTLQWKPAGDGFGHSGRGSAHVG